MATTGVIYDPIYHLHETGEHVEVSQRLEVIEQIFTKVGLKERLAYFEPEKASREDLELFHTPALIQRIEDLAKLGGGQWDNDTVISPKSFDVALSAVGGAIKAVDLVMEKKVQSATVLVRPPGHHAEKNQAMGFCLFNNGVIAVKKAQQKYGLKRILFLDWDAHHGNGTQEAFYNDPTVLFISIHQEGIFPQTGRANEVGTGAGEGFNVNIPVASWTGDGEFYYIFNKLVIPISYQYQPELIIISAGFDAHFNDYMSGLEVTTLGYRTMTKMIKEVADKVCDGKIVALLEGGYDFDTLGYSVAGMVNELGGFNLDIEDPITPPPSNVVKPQTRIRIDNAINIQGRYWKIEG